MKRWLPVIALLSALALVAAACGGDDEGGETTTTTSAPAEGQPLVMGSILPLSGDLAAFGPGMQNGVQLAVDEANAMGGVNGAEITYIPLDSGTSEQVAQDAANDLIAQGAVAEVGAASSGISLSILDLLTQNNIVMVSPSNTSPQFTTVNDNGFYFRTAPSDALQGVFTAKLLEDEGVDNLAIIFRQDSYGQGLAQAVKDNFTGTIVAEVPYVPEATDYNAEVTQIANANPGAVLCICFPETGVLIHQAAFESGLLGEGGVPWFYTDGMLDPTFPETAFPGNESILAGFKGTAPGSPAGEAVDRFTKAYMDAYGEEFTLFAPNSYDAAWLIILAAEVSDGTGVGIRDAMIDVSKGGQKCIAAECLELAKQGVDIDYVGASGEIDFDEVGDPGTALFQIWRFTETGDTETLEIVGG